MSGNQTTEKLREGLTERGIEWRSGLEGVTFVGDWCFVEYDNGGLAATCEPVLTPDQAIAATLGVDVKDCESLLWEFIGALDVADATDADKKPIVYDYARRIAATLGNPEIVRCRDCVNCYFDISSWMCGEFGFGVGNEDDGEPDGFCAWGVKRKDSGE